MILRAIKSVTLVELLISIVLIGLVILGLSNIELFCRNQLLSSERRLKVQNDASFVLEHMAKYVIRAVNRPGVDAVIFPTADSFRVSVDVNRNGVLDEGPVNPDNWIAYSYDTNELRYCSNMSFSDPGNCEVAEETLSTHINQADIIYDNTTNYLQVNIITCWDPDGNPEPCGSIKNPSISLQSRIYLPSVSTR
jgi:hypothetical protein